MENKTPQRQKAVRTRQRLLEATLEQIAENGYHSITVDRIAAAAGVSTGSAYRYFENKKEMLLAAIDYYYEHVQEFSGTEDTTLMSFSSAEDMLSYVLGRFYDIHMKYYAIHEELESLRHIDSDIRSAYNRILAQAIDALTLKCPARYSHLPHLKERLYLGIQLLESFAHTQMDADTAGQYDMGAMKELCIQSVMKLLEGN